MEQQRRNEDSVAPILCRNNCGFFGSPATNNFCSKCYKEYCMRCFNSSVDSREKENNEKSKEKEKEKEKKIEVLDEAEATELVVESQVKIPANRCAVCNRKVGLMGFKCRCENVFCSEHRYSDRHNCDFNYREAGQDAIAKANPIVQADKIDKI